MADGTLVFDIRGDDSSFSSTVRGLGATATSALSGGTASAGKFNAGLMAAATAAGNLATTMATNVVHAVGQFASSVVEVGANFESAMSKVEAISGATSEEMDLLTAKAKEMGSTTQFTATESAEAMGYMAMAGWKTEDMLNGLEGVMSLAAASGEDLATTSDIVTDAMTALGLQAGDAGHFADVLAMASSNANTNVGIMGETFKYCASLAGAMGASTEDLATMIGLMANAGVKGSQSGTALRSILTRLVDPPKEAAEALDELGFSILEEDGDMKSLDQVMTELRGSFADMTEAEKVQYASTIAGQEAMTGFLAVMNATDDDVQKVTDAVNNCDGAAAQMAATMNDNLAGKMTLLQSAMDGFRLALYDGVSPSIMAVVGNVTQSLVPALTAMAEGSETASGQLKAGFSSALGEILTQLDQLAPRAAEMTVQLVSAVVVALVDNLPLLIDCVVDVVAQLLVTIGEEIPEIVDAVAQVLPALVETIVGAVPTLLEAAVTMLTSLVDAVPIVVPNLIDAIVQSVPTLVSTIVGAVPQITQAGVQLFVSLVQSVAQSLPQIVSSLISAVPTMVQALTSQTSQIVSAGVQLFTALIQAIPQVLPSIVGALPQIVASIVGAFIGAVPQLVNAGFQLIAGLAQGIVGAIPNLVYSALSACGQLLNSVLSFFGIHSPSRKMAWVGRMDMEGMGEGIEDEGENTAKTAERTVAGVMEAAMEAAADVTIGAGGGVASAAFDNAIASAVQYSASSYSPSDLNQSTSLLARIADAVEAGKTIVFSATEAADALLDPIDAGLRRKAMAW